MAITCAAIVTALWAPYVYVELMFGWLGHVPEVQPAPAGPVAGHWFDDYYVIEPIDERTFAIGEPRYYQANYSYLIIGTRRAVLFDAGTGSRDIVPVIRSLTSLPVTVIPSHLHFDHVGALGHFERTALIDLPMLRSRSNAGTLTLQRYEFLGFADRLPNPSFKVDDWLPANSGIDLGERVLHLWSTPGHTPSSVSLYDADRHQLFAGDYLYPGELYAFTPGASLGAYRKTAALLLARLDPEANIYTAHMAEPPAKVRAPVLTIADLRALASTLDALDRGAIEPTGFFPRRYPVRGSLTLATGFSWNNR
jgi:glyoxylase-like metal-dependent hydrolase (beta-lactamase superfamily II)